jgi:hypothetical protein
MIIAEGNYIRGVSLRPSLFIFKLRRAGAQALAGKPNVAHDASLEA